MMCNSSVDRPLRGLASVAALALFIALVGSSASIAQAPPERPETAPPVPASGDDAIPTVAVPDDGTAVVRIVESVRFRLGTSYATEWNAERSEVSAGTLIVLEVAKKWLRPRQTRQPVLYVGDRPAEVLNCGVESGKIVVIVPDREVGVPLDLAKTTFFYGTPMLPERVTVERGREELRAAQEAGITPLPAARRAEPMSPISLADRNTLLAEAGTRIVEHSPTERALGEGFRRTP